MESNLQNEAFEDIEKIMRQNNSQSVSKLCDLIYDNSPYVIYFIEIYPDLINLMNYCVTIIDRKRIMHMPILIYACKCNNLKLIKYINKLPGIIQLKDYKNSAFNPLVFIDNLSPNAKEIYEYLYESNFPLKFNLPCTENRMCSPLWKFCPPDQMDLLRQISGRINNGILEVEKKCDNCENSPNKLMKKVYINKLISDLTRFSPIKDKYLMKYLLEFI